MTAPDPELDERADRIRRNAAERSGHQRVVAWADLPEEIRERWRRAAVKPRVQHSHRDTE